MESYPLDSIIGGTEEFVYTTHVTNQHFYVNIERKSPVLVEIMDTLENRYRHLKPEEKPLVKKHLGGLCAVKCNESGIWHRSKIISLLKNRQIEVQFVDSGNTACVTEDSIKVIDPDLITYPIQSYRCCLVSCSQGLWTRQQITQFKERVLNKKCQAVFMSGNNDELYQLQMFGSDGLNINQLFAASRADKDVQIERFQGGRFPDISFNIGAVFQASIVHVNSPGLFWCQYTQYARNMLTLSKQFSHLHMIQEMHPLTDVRRGTVCVVKSSKDEAWYRGIVDSILGKKAKILFVDKGSTEVVSLDVIYNLKSEMRTLPALGIKCRLSNVENKGREWRSEIIEAFKGLVVDKEFEVKVVGKEDDVNFVTLLDVNNKDVGAQLQSVMHCVNLDATIQNIDCNTQMPSVAAAAAASGIGSLLNVGSKVNVYLTWVNNPGDFWVRLSSAENLMEHLTQELQRVYTDPQPIAQPYPGAYVVAKTVHGKKWYRSLVLKVFDEDELVRVRFTDYGNTDIVRFADLRQVTDEFRLVAPLASRCFLFKTRQKGDKSWTDNDKKFLEELAVNGCLCEIINETTSHKIVNLQVGRQNVASEILSMGVREANANMLKVGFDRASSSGQSLVDNDRNIRSQQKTSDHAVFGMRRSCMDGTQNDEIWDEEQQDVMDNEASVRYTDAVSHEDFRIGDGRDRRVSECMEIRSQQKTSDDATFGMRRSCIDGTQNDEIWDEEQQDVMDNEASVRYTDAVSHEDFRIGDGRDRRVSECREIRPQQKTSDNATFGMRRSCIDRTQNDGIWDEEQQDVMDNEASVRYTDAVSHEDFRIGDGRDRRACECSNNARDEGVVRNVGVRGPRHYTRNEKRLEQQRNYRKELKKLFMKVVKYLPNLPNKKVSRLTIMKTNLKELKDFDKLKKRMRK